MRTTILGFNQQKVLELGDINVTDLLLLDYIWRAQASVKMQHIADENNISYVWISHKKILEDLPILRISERELIRRLKKLLVLGLIKSKKVNLRTGAKVYYAITVTCELLVNNDLDLASDKIDTCASDKIDTCASDKIDTSDNKQLVNKQLGDKPKSKDLGYTSKMLIKQSKKDYSEVFLDMYNEKCPSLPKVKTLSDKRVTKINKLFKKYDKATIAECLDKCEASDFLAGYSSDWRANIDWIIEDNNFCKILDGNYDNHKAKNKKPASKKDNNSVELKYNKKISTGIYDNSIIHG